jgi:hemerythrin
MEFFQWDDRYLIDIRALDSHHKQLVMLLNKSYRESLDESTSGDSDLALLELLDYAAFHLKYEAQMIVTSDRSISEKRLKDISTFRSKMLKIQNYYFKPDRSNSSKMLAFMNRWVANHISEAKTFYSDYLTGPGSVGEGDGI